MTCCIRVCENRFSNGKKVSLHILPKNTNLRQKWMKFFKLHNVYFNPTSHKICDNHFGSDCFESDLRSELMYNKPRKILKLGSVPTILKKKSLTESQKKRCEVAAKRDRIKLVNELLKECPYYIPKIHNHHDDDDSYDDDSYDDDDDDDDDEGRSTNINRNINYKKVDEKNEPAITSKIPKKRRSNKGNTNNQRVDPLSTSKIIKKRRSKKDNSNNQRVDPLSTPYNSQLNEDDFFNDIANMYERDKKANTDKNKVTSLTKTPSKHSQFNEDEFSNDLGNMCEQDGLENIIAYVVKKFKNKYPKLLLKDFTFTYKTMAVDQNDHNYSKPTSWESHLSCCSWKVVNFNFVKKK